MDWHYGENGRQEGPVSEDRLLELVRDGVIKPDTLVWHSGMSGWRPFREAGPGGPPPMTSGPVRRYGGFWIRVGAHLIDGIILSIVEGVLAITAFGGTFVEVLRQASTGSAPDPAAIVSMLVSIGLMQLVGFGVTVAYFSFFHYRYGATPGKMACGLKVVTPEGGGISVGQAIGRYFGSILSGLILCIGFMMAGWDEEKRSLHDRMAGTRVIRIR